MKYDTIIIGAGIAGMTAAIYLKRAGKTILVLENKAPGGQIVNAVNIENWPGLLDISGAKLAKNIHTQMKKIGADFSYAEVLSVEKNLSSFVIKTDSEDYLCKTVIIATGTEPRKLSKKQSEDAGERTISYCATCDGTLYKNKPVVVVGSGNTAKHEIKYLENLASKVYHIHHDDKIPKDAVAIFVAIGRTPNTKNFQKIVKLNSEGYIIASEDCKTSQPGIFVAGDCRTKKVRQLVTAASDGAISAQATIDYLAKK